MTQFAIPPGFSLLEVEEDSGVMTPEKIRYQTPDGTVLTYDEMLALGFLPAVEESGG